MADTQASLQLREKQVIPVGEPIHEIFRDAHCILHPVSEAMRAEYLRYASWYYEGANFEALQCFWPSADGKFPWESDCDEATKTAQPDLREIS